jgi:hypothetical protein
MQKRRLILLDSLVREDRPMDPQMRRCIRS